MDWVADSIRAVDGPWRLIALTLILIGILLWRWMGLLKVNNQQTAETHQSVQHIQESIVTNHGSKNLGDAIDKLTEAVGDISTRLTAVEDYITKE